jgi:cytoplasmic FMR1 interacting protein
VCVSHTHWVCREAFGEGLHWAGCTLIALLDQYRRFEVLDFSYHLLRVNRVDGKTENVRGVGDVTRVCERIRRFQMLNAQIFDCLDKHLTPGENVDGTTPFENVRCFPPPVHSALVQHQ